MKQQLYSLAYRGLKVRDLMKALAKFNGEAEVLFETADAQLLGLARIEPLPTSDDPAEALFAVLVQIGATDGKNFVERRRRLDGAHKAPTPKLFKEEKPPTV